MMFEYLMGPNHFRKDVSYKYEFNTGIVYVIMFYFSFSFTLALDSCIAYMSIWIKFRFSTSIYSTSVLSFSY